MQEIASKKRLGNRLKFLRITEQLSQEELANILGISRSNYSQIELGKQYPTYQSLHLLCKHFNKDYNWILNSEDDEPELSVKQTTSVGKRNFFPFVDLVTAQYHKKYITKFNDNNFIEKLPQISFPVLDLETKLRAFEISKNLKDLNLAKEDIVICSKVENLQTIDFRHIYLVVNKEKLIFSKCAYNLANESVLIISKFKHEQLNKSEINELWKVQSKYSSTFGVEEQELELQTEKFETILNELRNEILKFKSSVSVKNRKIDLK